MKQYRVLLLAAGIGIVNAILLRVFELVVNDGTDWLWNDVFNSDEQRWVVLPLAMALGMVLSALFVVCKQPRLTEPDTDLLADINTASATLPSIVVVLLIGLISLLAGASLGPEASLMAASAAIGSWIGISTRSGKQTQLLIMASIGALLVAFIGSLLLVLVPLLLLYQKKKLNSPGFWLIMTAGLFSYGTLLLIDRVHPGFGSDLPLPHMAAHDITVALVIGFATVLLARLLNRLVTVFWQAAERLQQALPWPITGLLFGLGLGLLYLFGGQSVQFNGNAGSHLLLADSANYSALALLGLIGIKVVATAWSKATGYRGGLVFPSIYIGVAIGLFVGHIQADWGGAGAIIGGVAGMISAVTGSPVVAGIFIAAVLPVKLLPVAVAAIIGTAIGNRLSASAKT